MSVVKPAQGEWVTVLVHPEDNGGIDTAPALVVAVNDDGTATVHAHCNDQIVPLRVLVDVELHSDRASAEKALAKQLGDVPHRKDDDGQIVKPVTIDVARWLRVAFRGAAKPAKAAASTKTEDPPAA